MLLIEKPEAKKTNDSIRMAIIERIVDTRDTFGLQEVLKVANQIWINEAIRHFGGTEEEVKS